MSSMLIQKGKKKRAVQKIGAARCVEMSDLIERKAALAAFEEAGDYHGVIMAIKALPSVIPKIVKCGDCRWNDGTAYCEFHYRAVKGDDFCSWGEKK